MICQPAELKPSTERIVIPRGEAGELLAALHVQLNHPSVHQLKLAFCRSYFCLGLDAKARLVVESCHTCTAPKKRQDSFHKQSASEPSEVVQSKYSAVGVKETDIISVQTKSSSKSSSGISEYSKTFLPRKQHPTLWIQSKFKEVQSQKGLHNHHSGCNERGLW